MKNRALIFTLIASLTFTGSLAVAQPDKPFPDVPKDHCAYQAVMELKQKGILIGYPDGSFNGKGTKTAKPTYDLSTPEKTWKSLLLAMRNRNEAGIRYVTTKEFYEDGSRDNVDRLHPHVKTLKERLDNFQKAVKVWEKWDFIALDLLDANSKSFRADLYVHDNVIHFPSLDPLIVFKKTEEGWKIDEMWNDLE